MALKLQASARQAYLLGQDRHFAALARIGFLPIVTPRLTQLQIELQKQAAAKTA